MGATSNLEPFCEFELQFGTEVTLRCSQYNPEGVEIDCRVCIGLLVAAFDSDSVNL